VSIEPIIRSVDVQCPPERTFELFTARFDAWWPRPFSIGKAPLAKAILEPKAGGRWFETDAEGTETHWGKVLAYEPPRRLLLAWQIRQGCLFDPDFLTEVEVTFKAIDGGTRVTLEHRNLERFGTEDADQIDKMRSGWTKLMDLFAGFTAKA